MTEFEPIVFERVVQGAPDRTRNDTQLFVLRAMSGKSIVVDPDEQPILPLDDRISEASRRTSEVCRSNPSPLLDAADVLASRREVKNIENRGGDLNGRKII